MQVRAHHRYQQQRPAKVKKYKTSAEKAAEDAAAASSAEASGALKKLVDSGQAVDPSGATLPLCKSILKVTWGDSEQSKTGPTLVMPPHRRDMSPLLHLTPQVERGAPELEPLNLRSMQGKASNNAPPVALLQHNEGLGPSNSQVGPPMVEQTGMAMLPVLHERRSPVGTQAVTALGELGVTNPLQDHIRSEENVIWENMENRVAGNTQIKPPGQADGECEGTYQATGRSRDDGLWTPQGLPLVQRAEEGETVREYLRHHLHLPRVEQIASKGVTCHVAHPCAKNLFKVGTGEGQWSRHAISEQELASLLWFPLQQKSLSTRGLAVVLHIAFAIGAFGIGDSDLEITASSTHTVYDSPSYVELPTPEIPSHTSPPSDMDLDDHLWNMEEELMRNWMKTDMIETALQMILAKLDILQSSGNAMQDELDFGKVEVAEERMSVKLAKVKPTTLADFDRDWEKGHCQGNTNHTLCMIALWRRGSLELSLWIPLRQFAA
ncbi:hypothetical protein JB92DRAFT_3104996 [Gautieria morchelliformis]|nr:hypothetical protein JB92DRAFT_3104996 [Gautieria morchelliformis]